MSGAILPDSYTAGQLGHLADHATIARLFQFHVDNFGAVGDGVTDDTLAVRACLEAARDYGGGHVWGDPGKVYFVDTPGSESFATLVYSNTTVHALRFLSTPWNGTYPLRYIMAVADDTHSNISIEWCQFDGGLSGTEVDEIGCGFGVQGTGISVRYCEFKNLTGDSIKCGESGTSQGSQVRLHGNYIHDCAGQGIALDSVDDYIVSNNNIIDGVNGAGGAAESIICSGGCDRGIINGNTCYNWGTINVEHPRATITSNIVTPQNGAQAGVTVGTNLANRVLIADNQIDCALNTSDMRCILVQGAISQLIVRGNECKRSTALTGTQRTGGILILLTSGTPTAIMVAGNHVYNGVGTAIEADITVAAFVAVTDVNIDNNLCESLTTCISLGGGAEFVKNFTINGNISKLGPTQIAGVADGVISGNRIHATINNVALAHCAGIDLSGAARVLVVGNMLSGTIDGIACRSDGYDNKFMHFADNMINVSGSAMREVASALNHDNQWKNNRVLAGTTNAPTGTNSTVTGTT